MSKPIRSSTRSSARSKRIARASRASSPLTPTDSSEPTRESQAFNVDTFARARATKKQADPATIAARAPWVKNGIDYGPARAAFKDLAAWALDLVEHEVADVPADRKRVRNVRRALLGLSEREPSTADVMLTGEILARVLDRDLGLGLADLLAIFDQLELSSDLLPMWAPAPRALTPLEGREPLRLATIAPIERPTASVRIRIEVAPDAPPPPPLRFCEECGLVHEPGDHQRHYRNAA